MKKAKGGKKGTAKKLPKAGVPMKGAFKGFKQPKY
jgi:hypothetical protein